MSSSPKFSILSTDHITGDAGSEISLLEYGDYQCSHCSDAYKLIKKLQQKFGTRMSYVFRHFPLTDVHIYAKQAAIATEAAAAQNRFWDMHDIIYENQQKLSPAGLLSFATTLGLDMDKFKKDIRDKAFEEKVEASYEEGRRNGVNFTPFYVLNGQRFTGGSKDLFDHLQSK